MTDVLTVALIRANDFPEIAKNSGFRHASEPSIPVINSLEVGRQIDNADRCVPGNQRVFLLNLLRRCQAQCNATGILCTFLPMLLFDLFQTDRCCIHCDSQYPSMGSTVKLGEHRFRGWFL